MKEVFFIRAKSLRGVLPSKVYWIGDVVNLQQYFGSHPKSLARFDAITFYYFREIDFEDDWNRLLKLAIAFYPKIRDEMKKIGEGWIPNIYPGYDNRHMGRNYYLKRDPTRFSQYAEIAVMSIDPEIRTILIPSWNEWHEDTQIESAKEYYFKYLEVIKEFVRRYEAEWLVSD